MLMFNHRFVLRTTLLGKHYIGDLETGNVMILNDTATYVLGLIQTSAMTHTELITQLSNDYQVLEEQIFDDVQELLDKMIMQGVLNEES